MVIEIDQSGKIEFTSKDTVLALSNGIQYSIVLKSKEKRRLQEYFRSIGLPRKFVILTFCAMLSILFQKTKPKTKVTIDREYFGLEKQISDYLNSMLEIENISPIYTFGLIGKHSQAHFLAKNTAQGKKNANYIARFEDILREVKKTDKYVSQG